MKRPIPLDIKLIASPEDFTPTNPDLKVAGGFNSSASKMGENDVLLIRVAETPIGKKGEIWLPYFEIPNKQGVPPIIGFDIYNRGDKENLKRISRGSVKLGNGTTRLKDISHFEKIIINAAGEIIERSKGTVIPPAWEYERFGMEDPRTTQMYDGTYVGTFVSPHRKEGVSTGIFKTKNFKTFKKLKRPIVAGIKDIAIFPEKVPNPIGTELVRKGKKVYAAFTRPNSFSDHSIPGMWVSYSPDLIYWGQSHRLTEGDGMTGTGTPPISIKEENLWFSLFHQTYEKKPGGKPAYKGVEMGVDYDHPWRNCITSRTLLSRRDLLDILPKPGYTPDVVYPEGITDWGDIVNTYWGVTDDNTIRVVYNKEDLIRYLKDSS